MCLLRGGCACLEYIELYASAWIWKLGRVLRLLADQLKPSVGARVAALNSVSEAASAPDLARAQDSVNTAGAKSESGDILSMSTSVAQSDLDVSLALSLDKSLTLPVASRDKSLTLHVASSDELDVSLALSRDKSLTLPVASRDKSLTIHMASDTDLKFPYVFTLPDDKVVPPISMGTKDFGRCVGNVCTPEKTRKLLLEDIIAKGTGKRIGWSLDPKAKNTFLSGDHLLTRAAGAVG